MPQTPELRLTLKKGKPPVATVRVDPSKPVEFVGVFYTQHGQVDGEKNDATNTKNVFGITLRFRWARASQRPTLIFLPWTNPFGSTRMFVTSSRSLLPEQVITMDHTRRIPSTCPL